MKILWVGDAACSSGFARVTHEVLNVLKDKYDVVVLGMNYLGDPHDYPYDIYPCAPGGDGHGIRRLKPLAEKVQPDAIVIQNDFWNIPGYTKEQFKPLNIPLIGIVPVDGKNCTGHLLNELDLVVFWTEFGLREARRGGFNKAATVIPLGVDLDVFKPMPRDEAREQIGITITPFGEAFIVGNVNRNQGRKRMDLTIQYFAEWVKEFQVSDAVLHLQVAPTGDPSGYDLWNLATYYGIKDRLIVVAPQPYQPITERDVVAAYNCFNIAISTTMGEGFGLTTLEAMACGIPTEVPGWAALGEWAASASYIVPCTATEATWKGMSVIGGIPDKTEFICGLHALYSNAPLRESFSQKGLRLASQPQFRWKDIADRVGTAVEMASQVETNA